MTHRLARQPVKAPESAPAGGPLTPLLRNSRRLRRRIATASIAVSPQTPGCGACIGDCNDDGDVTIEEIIFGVNVALGAALGECSRFDNNDDGTVTIDELIAAVSNALNGCTAASRTPTSTATVTPAPEATLTPSPEASPIAGLQPLDQALIPSGHAARMLKTGNIAYVATSFGGVQTFSIAADGSLSLISGPWMLDADSPRCTTLALHPASATLYCAVVDRAGIRTFDLQDAGHLTVRPGNGNTFGNEERGYRDLYAAGDTLYVAAFDDGLLRAAIGPDGTLGPLEPAGIDGIVTGVSGEGEDVAVISRDRGLIAAHISGNGLAVTGTLPLAGPPLSVKVHDGRAVIALGSRGVVIAALGAAGPTLDATLAVPVVAMTGDLQGEMVAVGGPTGVFLIDRRTSTPALVGYQPPSFGVLDVLFDDQSLILIDWNFLETFRVQPDGHVVAVDTDTGAIVPTGTDARVQVANYGDLALHLRLNVESPVTVELAPASTTTVNVPAAVIHAVQGPHGGQIPFEVAESTGQLPYPAGRISLVEASNPAAVQKVALGSPFPPLQSTEPGAPVLPVAGVRNLIGFIQNDCALQWPEVEDLNWLARHDQLPEAVQQLKLLLINHGTWAGAPFMSLWGARDSDWARFEDYGRSLPGFSGWDTDRIFDAVFGVTELMAGPDTTAYYYIDELGQVRAFRQRYRGAVTADLLILPDA